MRILSPLTVVAAAGVAVAAFGLPSCSGTKPSGTSGSESSDNATAQLEIGNTLNYGSFGTTASVDCGNGKSLNVGGSNNTLTVTGTCGSVNILGTGNTVVVAKITESLTITGIDNTVSYRRGEPKVSDHGSGNTVKLS